MPITAKPYDAGLKILKRIFGSRPKIFSSEDLNQHLDGISDTLLRLSNNVGMVRDNWNVNIKLTNDFVVSTDNYYTAEINIQKVITADPAYVYYKGIRFELPTGDLITYTNTFVSAQPELPVGYLCLIAKKLTLTFADDPALCGLTSDEFPGQLPSSDVVKYQDERLMFVQDPSSISLGTNEELIGIIATVAARDISLLSRPDTTVAYTFKPKFERFVRYNAILPAELINNFPFQFGDDAITDMGFDAGFVNPPVTPKTNLSMAEMWVLLSEYLKRKDAYLRMIDLLNNTRHDTVTADINSINDQINAINDKINGLLAFAQVPVGGIIPYYGNLSNFNSDGKGKDGTPMVSYAICNGLNGTPDLRGRFLVGAISAVPSDGAPPLSGEVDPANPSLPGGANPNYALGNTGGEAAHQLQPNEMPRHHHGLGILSTTANGTGRIAGGSDGNEPGTQPTTDDQGGDGYHQNLPPYKSVYYIMRYK